MLNNSNIRVLSICTHDTWGGAARAAYRIHQGVRSLGVDSRMFVKNKSSNDASIIALDEFAPNNPIHNAIDWCTEKIKNQIQHYHWNKYPNKDANFKSDLRGNRLYGALQKMDYDVLHLHWINQRFINIDDLLNVHKPIVWTLHDTWPFCGVCHYFNDCSGYLHQCGNCPQLGSANIDDLSHRVWLHKARVYRDLNLHLVAPSRWIADSARQSSLFKDCDIRIIPNCLNTDVFSPQHSLEEDSKPLILYGAINAANDARKGFKSLLAALKILDSHGLDAKLVVFGANQHDLPLQFKHIEVQFVGYIHQYEQLANLYSMADVMVVPSYSEVFGQTASEAMACGTPVVAFRCTGIQDVVEEECGYLAEPYSSEDLAKGIRYCIEHNPNNVLGKAARASAVRRYAMDVVAYQYKALYNELMHE